MFGYNVEQKKIENAMQQLYNDFALKYGEIEKLELSDSEKQEKISELIEKATYTKKVLDKTRNLSELSSEDKEELGIKENNEPVKVDENVVNTLVSIYAKRAKMPQNRSNNRVLDAITLGEGEELEQIDTSGFEEELRNYFIDHYFDLLSDGYNDFLAHVTEVADERGILSKENGELIKIAMKHNLEPNKFNCLGYQFRVQDGLVAEEDTFGRCDIFYATPKGINDRISELYSKTLFQEKVNNADSLFLDDNRKIKNAYITYAEEHGIEIENKDALETKRVDIAKVQGIAKYINKVINRSKNIEKGDYTKLFEDDIIKNYSKIMNMQWYNFDDLESVKKLAGESPFVLKLSLRIEEDNITHQDEFAPDIAYGTEKFVKAEYQRIMEQVKSLHKTNAFIQKYFDVEKITAKKHAYRNYIKENGIKGIDISIPNIEIDHDKTAMIADAIMQQYGENCEDVEAMRSRVLTKLEDNWPEIVTEMQVMPIGKLFGEELKDMGDTSADEHLYVKDDFVYLGDYHGFTSNVIYATKEALSNNLEALDKRIASREFDFEDKKIRESLVKYAKEHGLEVSIPSLASIENRRKRDKEMFGFDRMFDNELAQDNPTARPKLDLNDTIQDTIIKMSEGLPGAIVGLASLLKADKTGWLLLLGLDDMNIRGSQIWEAYKYLYNEDGKRFAEAVRKRDIKMVDFINEELASVGGEMAVTGGASFDRNRNPEKYRFTEEEVEQLKNQREQRIERERLAREKMLANSPTKKKKPAQKRRENREAERKAYRERLIAKGKKSIGELDEELTSLRQKENQAKELYEQYEKQSPDKISPEV